MYLKAGWKNKEAVFHYDQLALSFLILKTSLLPPYSLRKCLDKIR